MSRVFTYWRRTKSYLLGLGTEEGIFGPIYFCLWIAGMIGTYVSFHRWHYLDVQNSANMPYRFAPYVIYLLGAASGVLLTAIYYDLHKIEHSVALYPGWQNLRLERTLRALILVSLLLGVGEVGHAFNPVVERIQVPAIREWLVHIIEPSSDARNFSRSLFVKGSVISFGLLTIWNGFALYFCYKQSIPAKWLTFTRMLLFTFLVLFSAVFWLLFLLESKMLSEYSLSIWLFFAVVAGAFVVLFVIRMTSMRRREFSAVETARWRARLFEIYYRMRVGASYETDCDGLRLIVLPNVYAPRYFTDSIWFAQEVSKIVGDRSLLEIGTGTGIVAIYCARNGARVVATDVNPQAVKNAALNADAYNLRIDVREGDVYGALAGNERFDFIFWAHPFNNWPEPVSDMLLRSGMDYEYTSLKAYIAGARDHLSETGRLLLGTGDTADLEAIYEFSRKYDYTPKVLKQVEKPLAEWGEERIRYMLVELVRAGFKAWSRSSVKAKSN